MDWYGVIMIAAICSTLVAQACFFAYEIGRRHERQVWRGHEMSKELVLDLRGIPHFHDGINAKDVLDAIRQQLPGVKVIV